jgi:hypothetical protein
MKSTKTFKHYAHLACNGLVFIGLLWVSGLNAQELVAPKTEGHVGPLRIGIALPFHAQGEKANPLSDAMMDYYLGLKLGFAELEQDGFQANVMVWDTEPTDSIPLNKLKINTLIGKNSFKEQDIMIGPVYEQNFKELVQHPSMEWKTPPAVWVSPMGYIKPMSSKGKGPFPNLNFFINDTLRYKSVAKNIAGMFPKHRICIVIDADKNSKLKGNMYKAVMQKATSKLVTVHTLKNGVLTPALPKRDSIVMASCISDPTLRVAMEKLFEKRQQCWLVADLGWFEDKRYYSGLNDVMCIYPTVNFTDFHDTATISFSKKFFQTYGFEPSRFGFIGYDQGKFIGYSSMAFGPSFLSSLPDATYEGLINSIHIKKGGTSPYNDGIRFVIIFEDTPHIFNQ